MAKRDISSIQTTAQEMYDHGASLRDKYEEIEDMKHGEWELPEGIDLDWTMPVISTDPGSALNTATRTLTIEDPQIYITPPGPGKGSEEKANKLEKWLMWQLQQANLRNDMDLVGDIGRSSLMYDYCAVQIVHMEHQLEGLQDAGQEHPQWYQDVKHYGDFALKSANPKNVYFTRSMWGLESVLHIYETQASEIISTWRGRADDIEEELFGADKDFTVTVYDYTDRNQRAVWVVRSSSESTGSDMRAGPTEWILIDEERDLPFIPWAIRSGGTDLESDLDKQVEPLLGRIVATGLWDLQNTIMTLAYSEAISTAASPRFAIIGPNGDIVKVDYHDPARLMPVPPNHEIQELGPNPIDEGLLHLLDRLKGRMDRETVARFLQNLDLPEGVAYASINAVMQAAISALDKYKRVAERTLADVFRIMAYYLHYRKDTSVAYGGRANKQITVQPNDFTPNALYIEVELSAHAPTDYMQRINAATAMNQGLEYPLERIYRFLGENDPDKIRREYAQEQLEKFELRNQMTMRRARQQQKMQGEARERQRNLQRKQRVATSRKASSRRRYRERQQPEERKAFQLARQQNANMGFNPNRGGMSPNTLSPGSTRERITGQTRQGDDTVT